MKKLALVFIVASVFCTTAMAADIAFYVGSPNVDGWYDVATQTADVATIIAETGHLFQDIQQFDDSQLDDLGAWVEANTDDGEMDILWLNGCVPSVLYPFPNVEPDGSLIEEWLDGGNMVINVGDWFGYVSYEGGSRQAENGPAGAANILGLDSSIIAGGAQGTMEVTPTGQEYLPSLNAVAGERPVSLGAVVAPWEVAAVFGQNAGGTYADPVVLHNTETGGYLVSVNQATTWIDDRGLTCAELIGNWVNEVIGLGAQPQAGGAKPRNGSMISQTTVMLEWIAGAFASVHDVYFGESFEEVEAATPDDPNVFLGTVSTEKLRVGTAGDLYGEPLVPGQTYYWRVDEVNDLEPNSPWKGDLWSFWVQPLTARDPLPSDGMPYVLVDQDLSWEPGMGALFHTVYFGESFEEVDTATGSMWMTPDATYDPGVLELGKTYYWRIDEFSGTGTHKGPVWSFTTVPAIAVSDPDLVGWWTLDEGMGLTALDWSGNGNHGTLNGGPQWVDGYHGGALEFGPGKYVDCGPDAAADVTADFTLAAWARLAPGNAGVYGGIGGKLTNRAGDGDYMGFSIVRHSSHVYRLWIGDGTTDLAKSAVNSDAQYADTEWHHVAGVREGQTNALYIDGVRQAASTNTGMVPSPEWFHIGRQYSHYNDRYFPGTIDDVRVYNKALTEMELAQVMRGNPLLAGNPQPGGGAVVDIRDATALRWSAGDTAASHDVYFGTDRATVTAADNDAAEFQGNQGGTSFSLAGLVEMGGGDYFWRIDEVEAAGTVQTGYVWRFNVPDYLIVDDFESYSNEVGSRAFETWIDGVGFTLPEPGNPGNGTGAAVGHDIWNVDSPHLDGTIMETGNVHGGNQAMPVYYDNTFSPYLSEADRTFTPAQNWTVEGVTTLVVHFRGEADNTGDLYVKINGTQVPYDGDPADITSRTWVTWEIDLASVGVPMTNVTTLTIGIEGGQTGVLYIDDILLTKP